MSFLITQHYVDNISGSELTASPQWEVSSIHLTKKKKTEPSDS